MVNGVALSRSFKPIRNTYVQNLLATSLPDGVDGELTSGKTFQSSSSGIMSADGEPDFKCWIFDYVNPTTESIAPYCERINDNCLSEAETNEFVQILRPTMVANDDELRVLEEQYLEQGFEGAMVRDPKGTYKFGRSTVKENTLLKVKRFLDDEAVIIDIQEMQHNNNTAEQDAFGRTKRSTAQDGKVGAGTAGTLIARNADGIEFGIGTGMDDAIRAKIWADPSLYIGQVVKYKYFPVSIKDRPRHPVFLGFRDQDDL
jgi:DNA ligase-1